MDRMSTRERIGRILAHREADRIPIADIPWATTLERWHREGLPQEGDWEDHLGVDKIVVITADNSPRYPERVLEETDRYRVYTSRWGVTLREWRHAAGTPHREAFTVQDPDSWRAAKARMTPDPDRIDWARLKAHWRRWREEGAWINGSLWFGFEVTYSHFVGVPLFLAMVEEPEWVKEMADTMVELSITLMEMVWEAGYHFDGVQWWNDMGYKGAQFMSVAMYRDLFKPADKRAVDWAHAKGLPVMYHSCGNVTPFVAEWADLGVDLLNPLEVKAGMDPLALKAQYGDRMAFWGGLDARLYDEPEAMWAEMERIIPVMKEGGGYIAGTDHSVPDTVSLAVFREFVARAKALGRYD